MVVDYHVNKGTRCVAGKAGEGLRQHLIGQELLIPLLFPGVVSLVNRSFTRKVHSSFDKVGRSYMVKVYYSSVVITLPSLRTAICTGVILLKFSDAFGIELRTNKV